jgi:Ca2+-transporting ATPase
LLRELRSDAEGLSPEEAADRLRRLGPNLLTSKKPRSAWSILAAQFRSLIVALLAVAAAAAFSFGRLVEGMAVLAVILLNAAIGFVMELRATRSMEALRQLGQANATVRRAGTLLRIPARELVCGDIVVFEAGDVMTADARLVEASKVEADESALTGESLPVEKGVDAVAADAPLAERHDMLLKGTVVTRGSGDAVVTATGMATELGQIARLVEEARDETTPLEQRLELLGRRLVWLTVAIAAVVAASGLISGRELFVVIETTIALAVATVPEGLPIVATLALARGMWRMAHRNALVQRLSAVETLGSTSVILTDKTGTLTENQMTVTRLVTERRAYDITGGGLSTVGELLHDGVPQGVAGEERLTRALRAMVLCNNAELRSRPAADEARGVGDPMELALLVAGAKVGVTAEDLEHVHPEVREEAFDPESKMMATVHRAEGGFLFAVKGAPEQVIAACGTIADGDGDRPLDAETRERWQQLHDDMAEGGLRVLAVADKRSTEPDEAPYRGLTLLALVGMRDVPRSEVRSVLDACHAAGVATVMLTGDHPATAHQIAVATGLAPASEQPITGAELEREPKRALGTRIVARTSPKQKLDAIAAHQRAGRIVAMIGDGVNDAPALRQADIGVAMGQRGTQVAREAADMVLRDDSLASVVVAIREGRVIFENIRKFVVYLLSCNVSELLAVGVASLAAMPLPIQPLQILFLNLVTDVFPALALGACDGEVDVMQRPPRPSAEPVLTRRHWHRMGIYGVVIMASVLLSLWLASAVLGFDERRAVTVSFLTLGLGQTLHVFNMRSADAGRLTNEVTRNGWVWASVVICVALLAAAVYLPGLNDVLRTRDPGREGWMVVVAMGSVPLVVGQLLRELQRRHAP